MGPLATDGMLAKGKTVCTLHSALMGRYHCPAWRQKVEAGPAVYKRHGPHLQSMTVDQPTDPSLMAWLAVKTNVTCPKGLEYKLNF